MSAATFPFGQVIERLSRHIEVEMHVAPSGEGADVAHPDVHRPGMGLMGFVQGFHRERIQVFGATEMGYLGTLEPTAQREAVRRILDLRIPGAFVARGLPVPEVMLEEARAHDVALAGVGIRTDELSDLLRDILGDMFAPRTSLHGTLCDVYGVGLLFTGRSGIGKSETALDLVERGHRLVADDLVRVVRRSRDVVVGTAQATSQRLMEIRGVGIVDVFPTFGVRAFRMQKRIEVEVRLEDWEEDKEYDRHGLDRHEENILGVPITRITVPVNSGKNISVIAEVIALDFMLKTYGFDAAREFQQKLLDTMSETGHTTRYLQHDIE